MGEIAGYSPMSDAADKDRDAEHAVPLAQPSPDRLTFDYIKSNLFRVIHVDGVLGGPGPRGSIHVNFFSERLPIPTRQVFALAEGALGKEDEALRESRPGIVREVETAVVMDVPTAKVFLHWLGQAIATVERLESERRSKAPKQEA